MDFYSFVYRGVLADEAIRHAIPPQEQASKEPEEDIKRRLPLQALDDSLVLAARKMAWVYVAVAAFENSVRAFIEERLLEEVGANWFDTAISTEIKKQVESRRKDEEQIRWHSARGSSPLAYVQLGWSAPQKLVQVV